MAIPDFVEKQRPPKRMETEDIKKEIKKREKRKNPDITAISLNTVKNEIRLEKLKKELERRGEDL